MTDVTLPAFPAFLSCRSHYAPSKAACTIPALVARAKQAGYKALGLMDDDTIAGCLEFAEKAKKSGIKPICGVRLKVVFPIKHITPQGDFSQIITGVVGLIALNETGWKNIQWLVAKFHQEHRTGVPIFDMWSDPATKDRFLGIACLSGSIQVEGESGREGLMPKIISMYSNKDKGATAIAIAAWKLRAMFSSEFYIEITRPGTPWAIEKVLLALAAMTKDGEALAPLIATPDVRYPGPDDHVAWRLIWHKHQGTRIREKALLEAPEPVQARYILSQEDMARFYEDVPEALTTLQALAIRANFAPTPAKPMLPALRDKETGVVLDSDLTFREQAFAGLKRIFGDQPGQQYVERLEREIGIIIGMGFPSYFLMVADFVNAAKSRGIQVGIGRGSGAGSLVAYCLGITGVDPLEYGLLFERFLNPDRVSMPDFDIDFCALRRGEVFQYLRDTYGEERTAQIITYMAPKPRGAVQMVYQVVVPETDADSGDEFRRSDLIALTKMIPNGQKDVGKSLDVLIAENTDLAAAATKSRVVEMLFTFARSMNDIYIQTGVHAAGIVLAPDPLADCMPVVWDENSGHCVCAYAMKYAEMAGFVKFDILSLETLTVLDRATDWIKKRHDPNFDLQAIGMDDAKVYSDMAEGLSSGSFQFETDMMKKGLRQVAPTRIHDLIALNALNRPGPMEFIPNYALCKAGMQEPDYPAPGTEEILGETYGIMIYQEQIMQIAQKVAGYTLGAADLLRRAMGKKDKAEMDRNRQRFVYGDQELNIPGCIKLGLAESDAMRLFDVIAKFADYGFNKSHAAVYAYLGYWTMWLKVHYPSEFIAAQITTKIAAGGKPEKRIEAINNLLNEAKASGIVVLPPSINRSIAEFAPEGKAAVRPGFTLLKGVSKIKEEFLEARAEQPFTDLLDFYRRGKLFWNKKQVNSLIDIGALDELYPDTLFGKSGPANRRHIYELMDWYGKKLDKKPKKVKASAPETQGGLDLGPVAAPTEEADEEIRANYIPDWIRAYPDQSDRANREFAAAGLFITAHPVREAIMKDLGSLGVKTYEGILERKKRTGDAKPMWNICVLIRDYQINPPRDGRSGSIKILFNSYSGSGVAYFNMPNAKFREARDAVSTEAIKRELEAAKQSMTPVVMAGRLHENGNNFTVSSLISAGTFLRNALRQNGWLHVVRERTSFMNEEDVEAIADHLSATRAKPADRLKAQLNIVTPLDHIKEGVSVVVSLPGFYNTADIHILNAQGGIATVTGHQPLPQSMLSPPKKLGATVIEPVEAGDIIEEPEIVVVSQEDEDSHEYGVEDAPNFAFGADEGEEKADRIEATIQNLIAQIPTMEPSTLSTDF